MPKYMTVHQETFVSRILLESRWTEIAKDTRARWQMTLFNMDRGKRFCVWEARDPEVIEEIFRDLGITWTDILEVQETSASRWRLWEVTTRQARLNNDPLLWMDKNDPLVGSDDPSSEAQLLGSHELRP